MTLTARASLFTSGVAAVALGAAAVVRSGVGAGPGDVFLGAVAARVGVAHGTAGMALAVLMALVATALGHRPRVGTVAAAASIGPVMNVALGALDAPGALVLRYAMATGGLLVLSVGVAAIAVARAGRAVTELLMGALAERSGRGEVPLRLGLEVGFLAAGVALGGPAGPFTVAAALAIGPLVGAATRAVEATWGVGVRGVSNVYVARLSRL